MDQEKRGSLAFFGGFASSAFLAACCLGMLALFGITSFVVTLGAWKLELVSDWILFPALALSVLVTIAGYLRRKRS